MFRFIRRNLMIIIVIGIIAGMFGFWIFNKVKSNDDITISNYYAEVQVYWDGTVTVKESWEMDYSNEYSVRFRDIDYKRNEELYPYNVYDLSNPTFDTSRVIVKVYKGTQDITSSLDIGYSFRDDLDELSETVKCEPNRSYCESIFTGFFGGYNLEGNVRFYYVYTLDDIILNQDGYLDFSHTLLGYAENEIEEGKIIIILPNNQLAASDFDVFGHMENSTDTVISNQRMQITFEDVSLDDPISFRVIMPETVVDNTNLLVVNDYPKNELLEFEAGLAEEEIQQDNIQGYFDLITFIVFGVFVLVAFIIKLFVFTNRGERVKEDVFYPPTNLSPAVVSYLLNKGKFKKEVITATLLDLCRRGYVEIIDTNKKDSEVVFLIHHTLDVSDLMGHEEALMRWLFGKDLTIEKVSSYTLEARSRTATDTSDFYKNYRTFVETVNYNGIKQKFKSPSLDRNKNLSYLLLVVPILYLNVCLIMFGQYELRVGLAVAMSFVFGIAYFIFIGTRYKYSKAGYKAQLLWKKYRKYVLTTKSYDHVDMEDVNHLDELLVFATLFGKADKVMEQLTIDASNPKRTLQPRQLHSALYTRPRSYYNYHRSYWYRPWYHTYGRRFPKPKVSRGFFGSSGGFSSRGGGFSSGGGRSFGGGSRGGGSRGGGGRSR